MNEDYEYKKLMDKHEEVEREIDRLSGLPAVDMSKIKSLKLFKLKITDKLNTLEHRKLH